jgi:chromosome segregation ATPase
MGKKDRKSELAAEISRLKRSQKEFNRNHSGKSSLSDASLRLIIQHYDKVNEKIGKLTQEYEKL